MRSSECRYARRALPPAVLGCALLLAAGLRVMADDEAAGRVLEQSGACKSLSFQDKEKAIDCLGTVIETTDADDRTDFTFTTRDGLSIRFRGTGAPRADPNDGSSIQTLDAVIVSKNNHPSRSRATGTCRFSAPSAGPSPVICRARSWLGLFQAVFLTDGRTATPTGE